MAIAVAYYFLGGVESVVLFFLRFDSIQFNLISSCLRVLEENERCGGILASYSAVVGGGLVVVSLPGCRWF